MHFHEQYRHVGKLTILPPTGRHISTDDDEEPDRIVKAFPHIGTGYLKEIRLSHLPEDVAL